MPITRRELLTITATALPAALASSALFAAGPAVTMYREGIIIEGLGGPGSMGMEPGSPLSDTDIEHVRLSGLTAIHMTVGSVGSMAPLQALSGDILR